MPCPSSCHKIFNDCRLDSFYRLVAGLDLINFGFFLIYAIEHKPNPGLKAEKTNGEMILLFLLLLKKKIGYICGAIVVV